MKTGKRDVERIRFPFRGRSLPATDWGLAQLWKMIGEMEEKLPPPKYFRVSVWGTKRTMPGEPLYDTTFNMCRILAEHGIGTVTGGGPGVMEAGNAGTRAGAKGDDVRTTGLRVPICGEPTNNYANRVYHHRTFHTRLHQFVRMSSGYIVFDPGLGTVLETILVWQLLKEGHIRDTPLVLVGDKWAGLLDWIDTGMVNNGGRRSHELQGLHHVATCDEVIPIILEARDRFLARTDTA